MYTITKKRQVYIPKKIMDILELKTSDSIEYIIEKDNSIKIVNPLILIQNAKGSVKLPDRFKNKELSDIIEDAKKEYFSSK